MAGSSTREVITLQFGHYSNFVGTHWWNIQESSFCYDPSVSFQQEINHDVLFREGLTLLGDQTYTPRLLMFDLKGSLKNLPRYGTLYQTPSCSNEAAWSGKISVHEAEPEPKNEFQMDLEAEEPQTETIVTDSRTLDRDGRTLDPESSSSVTEDNRNPREKYYNLDEDISVWSDFLGTCLHPKSIQLVRDFMHEGSANPFNVFGYGQGIVKDEHFYDEFENSLHFFVEECDRLQGFQVYSLSFRKSAHSQTCQLFQRQRHETFIRGVLGCLGSQPAGMRLAAKVQEFVDIRFSHTAGSHAKLNHPA